MDDLRALFARTAGLAADSYETLPGRRVFPEATAAELRDAFGGPLPETGADAEAVVAELAAAADAGLVAEAGGRYFGFVIGGALPATIAADWLTTTWDQNAGLYVSSPAASVVEEVAGAWLRELLGLPHDSSFGFVIGGQMANFTALAAAHDHVLARAGVIITPDIPDAIDSPTGEFTFGMLMQVAKLYRSQAGARFVSAKERAILAGIPVGPAPIGYRKRADRKLEVDPETAPIVRLVFERWARGDGRGAVAELLDTVPHVNPKTKTAAPWSREAVSRIIKNRLYATGRLQYGEIVSEWDAGAIVDEPLWHAAQRVVPPRPARAKDAGWLLTGLVRCASCGKTLKTSTNRSQYGVYRNYKCRNRGCPAPVIVSARRLEPYIAMRTAAVQHEFTANDQATDLGPLEDALAAAEVRLDE